MNDKHYPAGSSKGGQFAPKSETGAGAVSETALSFVPKTTSSGEPRVFFSDLPVEEQIRMEKDYINKHKDVLDVNDYLYDNFKTSRIKTPERDFEREQWVNDEFETQMNQGPKKEERRATLLLGLPGSGKSTIAAPLMKEMNAFIIDADNFKNRIPEFQKDHKMVSAVHHESVDLADKLRKNLSEQGYNMIIGKVGGDYESIEGILNELQDKGYRIDVIVNDVPMKTVLQRAEERYDSGKTDRLVPFWTTKTADKNVFNTFDQALKHPAVTGGKIYNNDVPQGTEPILLHEFKK